jgi:hypothetical protein
MATTPGSGQNEDVWNQMADEFLRNQRGNSSGQPDSSSTSRQNQSNNSPGFDSDKFQAELTKIFETVGDKFGIKVGSAFSAVVGGGAAVLGRTNPNAAFEQAMTKISEKLPDSLSKLSSAVGGLAEFVKDLRSEGRKLSNAGIGQGNYPQAQFDAQRAGYENIDAALGKIGGRGGRTIQGVGQTTDEASKNYFLYSKELLENNAQIKNMLKTGQIGPEDVAEYAKIMTANRQGGLDTAEQRREISRNMGILAGITEQQIQTSGMTRAEMLQALINQQETTKQQQIMGSLRNEAERDALRVINARTATMGAATSDVISKLYSGARLNQQDIDILTVGTKGRAGQIQAAVRQVKRTSGLAADDPARIAANKRLQREIDYANAYQGSREFNIRAQSNADPGLQQAYDIITDQNRAQRSLGQTIRTTGLKPNEAGTRQRDAAQQNLLGRTQQSVLNPDGGPQANVGAAAYRLVAESAENFRINALSAQLAFVKLNEAIGKTPEALEPLRKILDNISGSSGQTVEQRYDNNFQWTEDKIRELFVQRSPSTGAGVNPNRATNPPIVNTPNLGVAATGPVTINSGGPVTVNPTSPSGVPTDRTGGVPETRVRRAGTLGETGSPLEISDGWLYAHKGESVLNPQQLTNLISGASLSAASDSLGSIMAKMSGQKPPTGDNPGQAILAKLMGNIKESTNSTPGVDIDKKFSQITTQISSITGGGSTTTRRTQTADSQTAEAQLEKIKAQFASERDAIRNGIKSDLGPDAKFADINRAMRSSPEIKALEESLRATTADLSKRIDSGTGIEKSYESGIQRSQMTARSPSVPSVTDAFKDFKQQTTVPEIEQIAEEPAFEPIKLGEEVTLKDVLESLNQLNSTMGQMAAHTESISDTSTKQIRATEGLSSNRFS